MSRLKDFKTREISFWEIMKNLEMKIKVAESICLTCKIAVEIKVQVQLDIWWVKVPMLQVTV